MKSRLLFYDWRYEIFTESSLIISDKSIISLCVLCVLCGELLFQFSQRFLDSADSLRNIFITCCITHADTFGSAE